MFVRNLKTLKFSSVSVCNSMARKLQELGFCALGESGGKFFFEESNDVHNIIAKHNSECNCGDCR